MNSPSVIHATFVIERTYPRTPSEVFHAFADPSTKQRWYVHAGSHEMVSYALDFTVSGREVSVTRFKAGTPFPGEEMEAINTYADIVPDQRFVFCQSMSIGGRRISVGLTTFEFLGNGVGTDVVCTNQLAFLEGSDGAAMREAGWRKLLDALGQTLEAA